MIKIWEYINSYNSSNNDSMLVLVHWNRGAHVTGKISSKVKEEKGDIGYTASRDRNVWDGFWIWKVVFSINNSI